jgi:hypothetical protein
MVFTELPAITLNELLASTEIMIVRSFGEFQLDPEDEASVN